MKKIKSKGMTILLALMLAITLLPGMANAEPAVEYREFDWQFYQRWNTNYATNYTVITENTRTLAGLPTSENKWGLGYVGTPQVYVLNSDVTINERITVTGYVKLILMDGCTLTANAGITADRGQDSDHLTVFEICAQSQDYDTMGRLIADASGSSAAGIGGSAWNMSSAPIYIFGGRIEATGGAGAAGIGGSRNVTNGGDNNNYHRGEGTVYIYGGHVTATGGRNSSQVSFGGAGIGGGDRSNGHTVSIYGGTVIANPETGGAASGIGSGTGGNSSGQTIQILGGSVNASSISFAPDKELTRVVLTLDTDTDKTAEGEQVLSYRKTDGSTQTAESVYADGQGKIYLYLKNAEHDIDAVITTESVYERDGNSNTYIINKDHKHSWSNDNCDSKCSCGLAKNVMGHSLTYTEYPTDGGNGIREACKVCSHSAEFWLELAPNADLTYNGSAKEPLVWKRDSNWIGSISDYIIVYENNTEAGKATGKLAFRAGLNHSVLRQSFTILPKPADDITFPTASSLIYGQPLSQSTLTGGTTGRGSFAWKDSSEIPPAGEPECTVVFTPADAKNYDYSELTGYNASTKTVERKVAVQVSQQTLTAAVIGEIPEQTYTGEKITPPVTVVYGSNPLEEGTDYTVSCTNNINQGTAVATITGMGNYTGSKKTSFTITPRSVASADIAPIAAVTYNGSAHTPEPVVQDDLRNPLVKDTDYTVS